jgi:ribonuclease HI
MHFDGSKLLRGLGAGIILTSPKGDKLQYVLQMHFRASNNVAEYEALVHGLKMAKQIGIRRILCFGDFDLVTHQVSGDWDARDANMASYHFYMQQLSRFFEGCEFHHVPRANNDEADRLSKIGSTRQDIPAGVSLEIIRKPSIKPSPESPSIFMPGDLAPAQVPPPDPGAADSVLKEAAGQPSVAGPAKDMGTAGSAPAPPAGQPDEAGSTTDPGAADPLVASVFHIREIPSWVEPFSNYLITGDLPQDEAEARRIQRRAGAYTIINSELYKRSVSGIFQKCIELEEGMELLREIHQGECGRHASSRALVAKAFRHGFYWPTAKQNAEQLVKQCNGCQRFSKHRNTPAAALKTIPLTWQFAVWGLDMVGPFKTAPGGLTHLLVAVDKFTKWIEAKPIKKLDGSSTIKFFNEIITRYGVPHSIITDNGTNFTKGVFADYCGQKGIRLDLASVAHPQTNGQVEKANGMILAGIKPRLVEPLERSAGCWVEELPSVL